MAWILPVFLFTLYVVPRPFVELRRGGGPAVVDGDGQVHVEVAVAVEQPERELVEVPAVRPGGDGAVLVGDEVLVRVDELRQLVLLRDVQRAVDVLDAHRLAQALGDLGHRHLVAAGVPGDVVEEVHLAGHVLGAAPRGERQPPVGQPVHAGDLRFEAVRAQVGEVEVGAHIGERQSVTGAVRAGFALLTARRGDPDDPGVGAQGLLRDDREAVRARGFPGEGQLLVAAALEVVDAERMGAAW